MSDLSDRKMLEYVLVPINEYEGGVKALQVVDIIEDTLDRAPERAIPNIIRLVLGKELVNDTGEVTEHTEGVKGSEESAE